jgi:hypothetical protein
MIDSDEGDDVNLEDYRIAEVSLWKSEW